MLCMSASVHFVHRSMCACSGSTTSTFGTSPLRSQRTDLPRPRVVERDVEIGEPHEHARHRLTRRQRHRHLDRVLVEIRRLRRPGAAAAARHQELLLQRHRLVLRADALQIAGRRMARAALAGAVEERLAGLRIAREDVEHLIQPAVRVQEDGGVEERREVGRLLRAELEGGHALVGPAGAQERAELLPALVALHQLRPRQVGSARPAARVRAVAEAALVDEDVLAAIDRRLIELRIDRGDRRPGRWLWWRLLRAEAEPGGTRNPRETEQKDRHTLHPPGPAKALDTTIRPRRAL